jgi:hypothetical protein
LPRQAASSIKLGTFIVSHALHQPGQADHTPHTKAPQHTYLPVAFAWRWQLSQRLTTVQPTSGLYFLSPLEMQLWQFLGFT